MGLQIIKQEKDVYAIWTSYSDCFLAIDQSREEVIEFFVKMAADEAREKCEFTIEAMENEGEIISAKKKRRAFYDPPTMSFEQRLERHRDMEKNLKNETINALVRKKLKELGR